MTTRSSSKGAFRLRPYVVFRAHSRARGQGIHKALPAAQIAPTPPPVTLCKTSATRVTILANPSVVTAK
jgi:hypothetical protein